MAMPRLVGVLVRAVTMNQAPIRLIAVATGAVLIAACTGDKGQYPSLATRDVELVTYGAGTGPTIAPVPLEISPIIPSGSVSELFEQAKQSHSDFIDREPRVRRLATGARGTGRDSEARGRAIVALADLTSLRSRTEIPLADLDLLIAERTNRFDSAEDAIAAHAEVLKLLNEQDRTLNTLWRMLDQ